MLIRLCAPVRWRPTRCRSSGGREVRKGGSMQLPGAAAASGRCLFSARPSIPGLALALALAGCSSLPRFESLVTPELAGPRVSDIVYEIQCEILDAVVKGKMDKSLAALQSGKYVASVDLTLEVTDSQG